MNIIAIEPTPSPNTMKFTLSKELPAGKSYDYKKGSSEGAPEFVQAILNIDGVTGVYHVADFFAVERKPTVDWKIILPKVRHVFGETAGDDQEEGQHEMDEHFGEVKVLVHKFKGLPIQVKVLTGDREVRVGLPDMYREATERVTFAEDNIVMQRRWEEYRPRYGDPEDIAQEVAEELQASYTKDRLEGMIKEILEPSEEKGKGNKEWLKVTVDMLQDDDWRKRFAILDQMDPSLDDLDVLDYALKDEKTSIRRLATMYLGMIEDEKVLPYLEKALKDPTVTVRRTAGDAMSDIGSVKGIPAMIEALKDSSKIVRWRAAMFLYEVGDESALPSLKEAEDDPEFEVSMQIKLAIERIEKGEEAKGSIWKQMTEAFDQKN